MRLRVIDRFKDWIFEEEQEPRRATRRAVPDILVHYWDGSAPEGRLLRDISGTGAYILTTERWYPGTIVRIVLQGSKKTMQEDGTSVPHASACVPARVLRNEANGVAVEFVFEDLAAEKNFGQFLSGIQAGPLPNVTREARGKSGQALIEFALLVPLIFLLTVNAVNFGGFIFAWITVAHAARSGAQYMVMSSASPGTVTPATLAEITAVVTNDVSSLTNRASVAVAICTNKTASANACTSLTDPEAPAYTLATVDVTYTYKPFIPLFSFPRMSISATLPSGTIHRKAVMRMLQ